MDKENEERSTTGVHQVRLFRRQSLMMNSLMISFNDLLLPSIYSHIYRLKITWDGRTDLRADGRKEILTGRRTDKL